MSTTPHNQRGHSRLAPSAAARWTACTASVAFIAEQKALGRIPEESDSKWSREGTMAHEVAEAILSGDMTKMPENATEEMIGHAHAFAAYCRSHIDDEPVLEKDVPLWYAPGDKGHVDVSGNQKLKKPDDWRLHVIDYKYGAGVVVNAEENMQMAVYAASLIFDHISDPFNSDPDDDMEVWLHIYQPRSKKEDGEGAASVWKTTWGALKLFAASKIDPAVEVITNPDCKHLLKFAPSEKACRFCPAKAVCNARTRDMLKDEGFEPFQDLVDHGSFHPGVISEDFTDDETASGIFRNLKKARKWLDDIEEYALQRYNSGNPLPDTKMVEGKGSREYTDEEEAKKFLCRTFGKEDAMPAKLISPAQAEKLAAREPRSTKWINKFESLVRRVPGAPILTTTDDKRPAVQVIAAEEFADEYFDNLI